MSIKDKWQGYKDTVSGRNLRKTITPDVKRYNKLREERDEAYDRINPEFFKAEAQYNRYLRGLGGEEAVVNLSPFDSRLHRLNSLERKKDLLAATPHPDYYTYDEEMDKMLENPRTNKEIKDYRKANNRRALAIIGTPVAILGATGATLAAGQGAYNLAKKAIKKRAEDIAEEMEKIAITRKELKYNKEDLDAAENNQMWNKQRIPDYASYLNKEDLHNFKKLEKGRENYGDSYEDRYKKYRPKSDIRKERARMATTSTLPALGAGALMTANAIKRGKFKSGGTKKALGEIGAGSFLSGFPGYFVSKNLSESKDKKAKNKALIDRHNADKEYRQKNKDKYDYFLKKYNEGYDRRLKEINDSLYSNNLL